MRSFLTFGTASTMTPSTPSIVAELASSTGNFRTTGTITGTQLISNIATGTAPLTVTSTTKVANLNVDQLDGLDSTAFALASNVVTTVGALNGGTANANGATISGNNIYLQSASSSYAGLVDTTTQTFAGAKTFSAGTLVVSNANANGINVTGTNPSISVGSNITFANATSAGSYSTSAAVGDLVIRNTNANGNIILQQGAGAAQFFLNGTNGRIGIGNTTPNTSLDVSGAISRAENGTRTYTNVYTYSDGNNPSTGTFNLVLPKTWSDTMLHIKISGYDYSGSGAWEAVIGGYNYSGTSSWINTSAEIRGQAPFSSIRLAHDGSKVVILLGTTSTTWYYPKISVTNVVAGHSAVDDWGSGWSGSFIVSEAGIASINTPTLKQAAYSTNSFFQNGNSFGTTATLGTNDSQSLVLETANTARLTINSSGASTFAGSLQVNGSGLLNSSGYEIVQTNASDWLRINQNNSFTNGTAAYGNWAFGTGGISVGSWGTAGAGNIQATGSLGLGGALPSTSGTMFTNLGSRRIVVGDSDTGMGQVSDGVLAVYTNDVERMRIDSAGIVRVGTGTLNIADGTGDLYVQDELEVDGNSTIAGTFGVTGATTLSSTLSVTGNATFDTNTLFVDAANNRVGVGTNNPGYKLEVSGGHSDTQFLMHSSGDGGAVNTADLMLWASEPNHTYSGVGIANNMYNTTNFPRININRGGSMIRLLDNSIAFTTVNSSGTQLTGMTLNGSGNLSIAGTTTIGTLGSTDTATYLCRNSSNIISACNTTGTGAAFVQGGNSFGATAVLGTNDSNNLEIETAGSTRLTVGTNGNVGLGTTGTSYRLTVNYTAPASFTNAASDFNQMWQAGGTNILGVAASTGDTTARLVTNNGYNLAFNVNGAATAQMTLTTAGNLGIGRTNPQYLLDVSKANTSTGAFSSNAQMALRNSDGTTNNWTELAFHGTGSIAAGIAAQNINHGSGYANLSFFTRGSSGWGNRLTILSDGNVGIGDTNPAAKLTVNGNILASASSYLNFGTTSGSGGYGIRDNAGIMQVKNTAGSWQNISAAVWTSASGVLNMDAPTDQLRVNGSNAYSYTTSVLVNGDLEQWNAGNTAPIGYGTFWQSGSTVTRSATHYGVGSYSAAANHTAGSNGYQRYGMNDEFDVSPGEFIEISAYGQYSGTAGGTVPQITLSVIFNDYLNFPDFFQTGSTLLNANVCNLTTSWAECRGTIQVPAGMKRAKIYISTSQGNAAGAITTYIDKIQAERRSVAMVGGNVGIGTANPGNKLSVVTSGQDTLPALGSNGGKLSLLNDNGLYGMIAGVLSNGNAYLQAQRVDSTATAYSLLLQPNGGNVGIGTNNPQYALHVYTGANVGAFESNTTQAYLRVITSEGINNRVELANRSGGNLALWVAGGGDAITVLRNGNVGIGWGTPGDKLVEAGDVGINWLKISSTGSNNAGFYINGASTAILYLNQDAQGNGTGGWVTIGNNAAQWRQANLTVNGTGSTCVIGTGTGNTACTSDARKKNIEGLSTGNLAKIMQLQSTLYNWKNDPTGTQRIGLIAQNVQSVFPQTVTVDADGYLMLDYAALVSPLIGAVQEQQAMITDAQNRLTALENSIQPSSNNILDLTNGGTIQGNLNVVGNLNVTGPVTMSSLTVTDDVVIAGNLTVQNITVANITINGHIITAGNTPTTTIGTAAGTEDITNNIPAPQVTIEGNDTSGTITIVAGANTTAGNLVEVNFSQQFSKTPKVVLTAGNEKTSELRFFRSAETGKFLINLKDAPQTNQTYQFDYFVVE